jgi:predicted RNA methylase
MAAIATYQVDQGATFTSDVTVKDANDNPFNLTGYTAEAKLAKGYASTRTRTSFTATVAADATTGVVTLSLTATQTAALDAERYVYDLEITQTSSGNVTRVIEGIISVTTTSYYLIQLFFVINIQEERNNA